MTSFTLYTSDGLQAHVLDHSGGLLPPWVATWTKQPVDEALDGTPIYGLFAEVTWDWSQYERGVSLALVDLLSSLRASDGTIRFRTRGETRDWVICTGRLDFPLSYTFSDARARAVGLVATFRRVQVVG